MTNHSIASDDLPTIDPNQLWDELKARGDFFNGGGGGGGGGGWQPPNVYNLIEGFEHSVEWDGVGNQRHTVSQNGSPVFAAGVALQPKNGSVVGLKYRSSGAQSINMFPTLDTSGAPPPGGGPWDMTVDGMQIVARQDSTATGTYSDSRGSNQIVYSFRQNNNNSAAAALTMGDGTGGSWKLDLPGFGGLGPDMQLDPWALLLFFMMCIAFAAASVFLPIWAILVLWLIIIGGAWWIVTHW